MHTTQAAAETTPTTLRTRLLNAAESYEAQARLHNTAKSRAREYAHLMGLAKELRERAARA